MAGVTWFPVTDGQLHSSSRRRRRRLRIESGHRLSRHGRDRVARQYHARRRRLQIRRRRQDLEAHRPAPARRRSREFASIPQIRSGLCRRVRGSLRATNPIAAFSAPPTAAHLETHPCIATNTPAAVDRSGDGSAQPAGAVRVDLGLFTTARPWTFSSGGPASGLFKSTDGGDTWTEITRNRISQRRLGKINVSHVGGGFVARVRDGRSR